MDISNMNNLGQGITNLIDNRSVPNYYYVKNFNLYSKPKDKFKLLFEIIYPEHKFEAILFALKYKDYRYLSELLNEEETYLFELIQYAMIIKDYKFFELIISKDLPISIYERAYRMAHNNLDEQAKDLIWNKISQRTLLRFEAIEKIHPDLKYKY